MTSKLARVLIISFSVTIAACNTVRGAAADINSAANCTENAIKSGTCR